MGISFPNIPANLRIPLFQLEFAAGGQGGLVQQNTLIVANTITVQPFVPVFVSSAAQAVSLFGGGSLAAAMVERLLQADPFASLYVLPAADSGGGTAATGTITFTGPATAAGTLALYIAGRSVPVAVASGNTATQIATAVSAAINAYVTANGVLLPVTASPAAGVVTLTAANKGTHGNSIDVRLNYYGIAGGESTPPGVTAAIVAMASGASDPTLAGLDAALGENNFDFIAVPWSTAGQFALFTTLMSNASGRWSWLRQIYGHVFAAKQDTDATGSANITFGATLNDPHLTVLSYEPAPPPPWEVAAQYCGAFSSSSRADPARPTQTLALPNLLPPPAQSRYTMATQQSLLAVGLALGRYTTGGIWTIMRAVTTYQKNASGTPDTSYLDSETLLTLMAVVRQLKGDVTAAFPRAKLAANGTNFGAGTTFANGAPDQPITTPNGIRSVMIASYQRMVARGLVQDVASFQKGLIVQLNTVDPTRVDVLFDPILVSGLRILAVLTQFYLMSPSAGATATPAAA